jgi:cell division septal protein FtsQ
MDLERHPWIERAAVKRELPRRLRIRVRERAPVAIVAVAGTLHYLDRGARILGPLREEDSRDFPILSGLDDASLDSANRVALLRALRLLRWCDRLPCFDEISEIQIDRNRGLTVFPLSTPVPIAMGWGSWPRKLALLARVVAQWQGQMDRLEHVDVSFRNLAIVRLRAEPEKSSRRGRRGVRI